MDRAVAIMFRAFPIAEAQWWRQQVFSGFGSSGENGLIPAHTDFNGSNSDLTVLDRNDKSR